MLITSRSNNRIKEVAELCKSGAARKTAGQYVVEGPRMAGEVSVTEIAEVFASSGFLAKNQLPENVRAWAESHELTEVSDEVYEKMSDTKSPQGILVVARMKSYRFEDLTSGGPILVLENIQDPGNLGTMFRTGEGAGVGGVIMDPKTVDPYNPKVIRGTMGAILRVPFVTMEIKTAVEELKKAGYEVFAAHLKGEKNFTDIKYGKAAFMIGNEGNGLSDETANLADTYLRIPMEGKLESLNAAVAASLLVYEWHRQNH